MPDWLSGIVGNVAESTLGNALLVLLKLMAGWTTGLLDFFSSWWLGLDPADVGPESGAFAAQQHTHGLISIIGVICTVIALVRIARNRGAGPDTTTLAEGLIRVTVVSAAGLTGYQLLGQFSSAASPWLFRVISGEGPDYKFSSMMDLGSLTDQGLEAWAVGVVMILLPLVMIAGLIQAFLAMGTDLFGGILVALMPLTAAASVISGGKQAFNKQLSWVLSCGFFKPVAAVILGVGAFMAKGGGLISSAVSDDTAGPFVHTFQTFICLIVGCFALPALLKLFAPVGSMMGSNAGSGFVAAAGGAAAGASFSNSSGVSSSSGTSNTVDSSSSSSPSGAGDAGSSMESATSSVADTGKKAAGAAATVGAAAATGGAAAGAGAAGAAGSGAGAGASAAGSGAGSAAAGGEAATSGAGAAESSGAGAKTAAGQSGGEGGTSSAGAGAEGSSAAEGAEAVAPGSGSSDGSAGPGQGSSTGAGAGQSSEPGSGSTPPKAPDAGGPSGAAEADKSQSDHGSGWRTIAEKGVRGAGKSLQKTNETANEFIDPEGAEEQ
jgi:type IV secretion system protein TrbL